MPNWRTTITLTGHIADEEAAELGGLLDNFVTTIEFRPDRAQVEISLTGPAADVGAAVQAGLGEVSRGVKQTGLPLSVIGVQALAWEEYERRLAEPTGRPDLVGAAEAGEILGVSRSRVHQLAERPDFPAPEYDLTAGKLWNRADVIAFDKGWERRKGRPRKSA